MGDFGQSRVGQPTRFGRQGGAQAAVFRPHQRFQADHAGNAAPGAAEAPGEGVKNFILRLARGDEGEEVIHLARSRPAAELAGGGVGTAEFLGQVLPRRGGAGDPEDGVEGSAEVRGRAAGAGEEVGEEEGVFGVGQRAEGVGAHGVGYIGILSGFQGKSGGAAPGPPPGKPCYPGPRRVFGA